MQNLATFPPNVFFFFNSTAHWTTLSIQSTKLYPGYHIGPLPLLCVNATFYQSSRPVHTVCWIFLESVLSTHTSYILKIATVDTCSGLLNYFVI